MKQTHNVGLLLNSSIKNVLTLYINDEIVLKGNLETDASGEFQSMYDGRKLSVECGKDTIFSKTTCLVHLGKKRMGNFELNRK